MSELIKYRDDVEFPLTVEGRDKILSEGSMQSPTIYDGRSHHFDPSDLDPFGGSRETQLRQVVEVLQRRVAIRTNQSGLGLPCFNPDVVSRYFGVKTAEEGAEKVRADDPAWHPTHMRQWLHNNSTSLAPIFTADPSMDFTNGPLPVAACMDALPFLVSPSAFAVKYYFGLARPEQIVTRALTGEVETPDWFMDVLEDLGITLENVASWFQYRHPLHPDYIAMHAAVAAFGLAAQVFFLTTPEQDDAIVDYQENVAHDRDNGGVHTWSASHDGVRVGKHVIAEVLPGLVEYFGGDRDLVEERIRVVLAA